MEGSVSLTYYDRTKIPPRVRPVYDEMILLLREERHEFPAMDVKLIKQHIREKKFVCAKIRYIAGNGIVDRPIYIIGRAIEGCYCLVHTYAVHDFCSWILVDDNGDIVMLDDLSDVFLESLLKVMKGKKSVSSKLVYRVLNGETVKDIWEENRKKRRFRKVRNLLERT